MCSPLDAFRIVRGDTCSLFQQRGAHILEQVDLVPQGNSQ
jgi:hypothetical protein